MNGVLFLLGFIISIVLLIILRNTRKVKIGKLLISGSILTCFWLLMEMLSYYIKIESVVVIFQKLEFLSIAFIPTIYILLANEYVHRKIKKPVYIFCLFIIPILSMISLSTNYIPYRFISNIHIETLNGAHVFRYNPNIGFWIHTAYSYSSIIVVCYIFMMRAVRSSKLYRKQSIFIFISSIILFSINILFIALKLNPAFDPTPLAMLSTLVILYIGLFYIPKSSIVPIARELVIENIDDIAIIFDSSNRVVDLNPAAMRFVLKYNNKNHLINEKISLTGMKMKEVLKFIPNLKTISKVPYVGNDATVSFDFEEKTYFYRFYQSIIYDVDKTPIGKIFMFHDITQMQEYMNSLSDLNERLTISDRIIDTTLEGVLITDSAIRIVRVNSSFEKMSGYTQEEVLGKNPRILKSDYHDRKFYVDMWRDIAHKGYWEGEIWDKKKTGELYPKWMSITSLKISGDKPDNYIAISTDITKIKKTENSLESLVYYDVLTGIPNRTLFYEKLERALIRSKNNGKAVALFFMDLDGFKIINDSLGHAAGDLLLKEVALRMKACIGKVDTVARLGGDEFTVILENIDKQEDISIVADCIIEQITKPYTVAEREITLGISIGIAIAPDDETTVEGLVRKAEAAMYDAKEAGKGRYSFSSEEIEKKNYELLEIQIKLSKALENKEFQLYLQPQIALIENRFEVVGAEALIRWQTKGGETFTPDKFIPICERNGMIIDIGKWILEEIFRIDKILKENGINIKLSINVSSRQFEDGDLVSTIKSFYDKNMEQKIDLGIEITESFLLNDIEDSIDKLMEIKKLGISIALDDFGTGFSSLNYLTKLPIDYLKIDKSFIDDIVVDKHKNLTPHIILMAKTLEIKTVAEGVETKEQVNELIEEECDLLQGYYFNRPLKLEDFISYVNEYDFGYKYNAQ